ncbi:PREDICTED: cysteine protease inhibitor WSCP-like isoform X3 [Camelina sativa]|uniref:Cysteine protease inhibitor WSCP-like isoform X1 n=1 Tax=Camelina sativa TaxID=90675 RepID=A0ABM0STN1_CAMSA|nr:PREDICTED: cysteine protease inhibitor WSCP-like isoform X1 [Camelina sativa]XP_010415970.1 PREDICTED: cysteine protease inhibitor WSCP-like isoform X2 [Camelina sativa]XP_010415971.1 PREDICTED: cysteine protease inhibitor WSCP-like isoform X3 [Camelina sativa]
MKKPSVVSFLITLMFAASVVCIQGQRQEEVKDGDGNPVKLGEQYYIQPVKTKSNNGGGLVPAATNRLPICPLAITQTLLPYQPGLPVSFNLPYALMETIVKTFVAVNIEFRSDIWPVCNEFSKFWEVDVSSPAHKEPKILIGGKPQEKNSWFKIENAGEGTGENTYKLTTLTGTVGATPGVWAWLRAPQLIITNDDAKTLLVKFKKVDDASTAATSTSRVEKPGLRMFPFY